MREGRGGISQVLSIHSYIPCTMCGCKEAREIPGDKTLLLWAVVRGAHGCRHPAPSSRLEPLGLLGAQCPWEAETEGGRYWGTKSQLSSALKITHKYLKVL